MGRRRGLRLTLAAGAALVLAALGAPTAGAVTTPVTKCDVTPFDPASFTHPTTISNQWLPLVPGWETVLGGTASVDGKPVQRTVTFTVTDVTKVVGGVRSVVVRDVDQNTDPNTMQSQVAESELSFWAQDDVGNVWNVGEYPEEYVSGQLSGAQSTWIAGIDGAMPGIHMFATLPPKGDPFYQQGRHPDPDFGFWDCANVHDTGQQAVTPAGTFDNTLVTEELSPLDLGPPGGFQPSQLKYHALDVGIVLITPVNDMEAETLALQAPGRRQLSAEELAAVRQKVLEQDARGYDISPVYAQTARAEGPPSPPSPPPPPPPPTPPPPPPQPESNPLTKTLARTHVRRTLVKRLRRWKITRVTCRLRADGRATCTFEAKRRGKRLTGQGIVTRQASGALRARLTVRITTLGCRPAASKRCRVTRRWSS